MKKQQEPGRLAVIYARYSSHNQRDVSIDQQVKVIRNFAREQGMTILEVYADRAISGTTDNRPEFQRMIADSKNGAFQYVIVYSLDRFARDRFDSVTYKRILKNNGVRVLSAMERVTDDASGVLMEAVLEGLAEYYSRELSTKIRRGLQDNAEKCMVATAIPYGYKKGPDGKFAINPEEAAIVREIFNRVRNHDQLQEICRDLNARGVKTKRGGPWNKSSFNRFLANERYIGTYIYGDMRIEGGMPAIVDAETFYAVQETLAHKSNPRGFAGRRRGDNMYLLTGKALCGLCKAPLIGNSGTSKSGKLHTYYVCKNQIQEHTCEKQRVRQEVLEYAIASAIRDFAMDDDLINSLVDSTMAYQESQRQETEKQTALLEKDLRQTETAINNLMAAIEQGILTDDTKERMFALSDKKKALKAKISLQQSANNLDELPRETILATFQLLREGEIENRAFQELLFDMFLRVAQVYDDRIVIVVNYAKNGHDTIEIPFNVDDIPEVKCSFKKQWWGLADVKRTPTNIYIFADYVVISIPFNRPA